MFSHNGVPASEADIARMAFAGFAHFTAMQLRDGAVRGLDLHLARLRVASETMFGTQLHDDVILSHLREAIMPGKADASVAIFVASTTGEFEAPSHSSVLETFVRVSAPADPPAGPLSLDVVEHERDLPHVKHVGEVGKTLHLRRARARGFDDALFVNRNGHVSEATIWNVVFWDGSQVVWPRAAILDGVTQQVVRHQLLLAGVEQSTTTVRVNEIDPRWSAAIMNSWSPGIGVSRVGSNRLADSSQLLQVLHAAFEAATPTPLHGEH